MARKNSNRQVWGELSSLYDRGIDRVVEKDFTVSTSSGSGTYSFRFFTSSKAVVENLGEKMAVAYLNRQWAINLASVVRDGLNRSQSDETIQERLNAYPHPIRVDLATVKAEAQRAKAEAEIERKRVEIISKFAASGEYEKIKRVTQWSPSRVEEFYLELEHA